MSAGVVLFLFFVCLLIAIPISTSLGIVSVLPGAFDASFTASATYVVRSMFGGLDSFPLLAVPMFILSGIIMARGGISKRLFDLFSYFIGKKTAGLPCAVVVTCLFYGAISGSGIATVAAVGSMTIPLLVNLGYDKKFCTALVAVAGSLGVIIPPSIPFIMFGMASGVSVSDIFLAGIVPGLLIGGMLMVYAVLYCKKNGEDKEKINYEIDINNYLNKGKVIIHKLDTKNKEVIANTLIEIRNKDNVIVYKGYTDNNGMIVIDDLLYGEYYIAEIEASTGDRILEDNIYFTLDSEVYETTIYNERLEVPDTGMNVGLKNILVIAMIILFGFVLILFFDNKKIVGISAVFIIIGISYFGIYFYNYFTDSKKNILAIEKIINNDNVDVSLEDRYGYNSFIEIPSIELKRGLVTINNSYNNVNDNIEIIEKTDNRIILASHNGNNYNSYFGNLYKMDLGDKIYLYENGNKYEYIFSDNYEIKKNGYANIYTDNTRNSIALVTCKEESNDAQVVYIGYLINTSSYLKEQ